MSVLKMNRKELQTELKEFKALGYILEVKLNSSHSVLEIEYIRIKMIKDEKELLEREQRETERIEKRKKELNELYPQYVKTIVNGNVRNGFFSMTQNDPEFPLGSIFRVIESRGNEKKVKCVGTENTFIIHIDHCYDCEKTKEKNFNDIKAIENIEPENINVIPDLEQLTVLAKAEEINTNEINNDLPIDKDEFIIKASFPFIRKTINGTEIKINLITPEMLLREKRINFKGSNFFKSCEVFKNFACGYTIFKVVPVHFLTLDQYLSSNYACFGYNQDFKNQLTLIHRNQVCKALKKGILDEFSEQVLDHHTKYSDNKNDVRIQNIVDNYYLELSKNHPEQIRELKYKVACVNILSRIKRFISSKSEFHQVFYNGEIVTIDKRLNNSKQEIQKEFKLACYRIMDNTKVWQAGYVKTPDRLFYQISGNNGSAKLRTVKDLLSDESIKLLLK